MTAPERARSTLLPSRTACSALMALLALALVSFAQAEVSASTASAPGGAGISAMRQGETLAWLRIAGKAQALVLCVVFAVPSAYLLMAVSRMAYEAEREPANQ
ncbi:MAG: hypothetical protein EOQ55_25120 [Mesorhizobium sp.]|uniref:hypothetical protein n=1 Tax=unclassified Mesorhizobium TaxID=325217 RepID=UPI000FCBFA27|nr:MULTISPECIES: hypothetical protein [unclassified Mesorhizobium]RUV40347.1 hypothetical protein EOD29_28350 [Mesorhizobium sp. M1A.T.Ca.IN.004.03.1.1]RWG13654.1 MAG: hypothetical protein EOQ55_25120 [Mesorhizobium sp.]RWI91095.1 MAG: hypothetical protein EOR21_22270 [Mesorhizobium sp.]RWK37431.1 MAG: hypothetical protein EOR40_10865 [Mesorhizobium sp.]RWK92088.1 MAG: hypothetical protein EOR52_02915 [Mesorhizobium sp.]